MMISLAKKIKELSFVCDDVFIPTMSGIPFPSSVAVVGQGDAMFKVLYKPSINSSCEDRQQVGKFVEGLSDPFLGKRLKDNIVGLALLFNQEGKLPEKRGLRVAWVMTSEGNVLPITQKVDLQKMRTIIEEQIHKTHEHYNFQHH